MSCLTMPLISSPDPIPGDESIFKPCSC
jgi:hypothetical protein